MKAGGTGNRAGRGGRARARWAAAASWVVLATLVVSPAAVRSNNGGARAVGIFCAAALSALLTRLAFRRTASRFQILAFVVGGAAIARMRRATRGRRNSAALFAWSSIGAALGVAVGRTIAHHRDGRDPRGRMASA